VRGVRTSTTIELQAPITTVWEVLAGLGWCLRTRDEWRVQPVTWDLFDGPLAHRWRLPRHGELTATSVTTAARSPDVLTWELAGDVVGHISFELDDLDEVTFVRCDWDVRPSPTARFGLGPRGSRRLLDAHDRAMTCLADTLGERLGVPPSRVRPAGDRRVVAAS
jgi:hypothetical protein